MLKQYFLFAWRNLRKNKFFSVINIAGLAVGITCTSLIFLWVEYCTDHNRILPGSDEIYVVKNNQQFGNETLTFEQTCGPLGPAMMKEVSGFREVCRTLGAWNNMYTVGEASLTSSGLYADSNFFRVFHFPIIEKTTEPFLNNNHQIAISLKMANAFFGNKSALGQTIRVNKKEDFIVSAVYDVPSANMDVQPACVMPLAGRFLNDAFNNTWSSWGETGMVTYATLHAHASADDINRQLKNLISEKTNHQINQSVFLYPYIREGLYNNFVNGKEAKNEGLIRFVKMFSLIAGIILILACINFMNLSTARSEKRAKEIGLKKVVGVTRLQLILQFLSESLLTSLLALALAVLLLLLSVPAFSELINVPLQLNLLKPSHLVCLLVIAAICGLLAGSYPALFLSSFHPIRALKQQAVQNNRSNVLRKSLVVIQFSVSVFMLIGTLVIFKQINHTKERDLGYNKDHIVLTAVSESLVTHYDALKQQLLETGQVEDVALSWGNMFNMYSNGSGFHWKGKADDNNDALITMNGISANYLSLMGITLREGRYFHEQNNADSNAIIINPALAKLMGKEGRIGGKLYQGDDASNAMTIVGITKPFVFNNIYATQAEPMYFLLSQPGNFAGWGSFFIKLKPSANLAAQMTLIGKLFKQYEPARPFDYYFLNDSFERLFRPTLFIGKLALLFGGLAIFISCLGLFGLAAFMAEQRTREIGIRKVLGASVGSISSLLSADFLKLVLLSLVIAIPMAAYIMYRWLMNYPYRIQLDAWIFLSAGAMAVFIALVTVSTQAIKAAMANPVTSLRSE